LNAVVLLSGGLDSAACVAFFQSQGFLVKPLFVDYGQCSGAEEERAAQAIANHFGATLSCIRCSGTAKKASGLVTGRNAFLLCLALLELDSAPTVLSAGIHAGTDYWDCSDRFAETMQVLVDGCAGGRIKLNFPFLRWNKRQIFDYCLAHKVPVELTYSCEAGTPRPCGNCLSCRDRKALCS
jgi:7-cyano-7-deazaguanine synthase